MTIKQFVNSRKIRMSAEWADENPNMADMPPGSNHWTCTIHYGRRRMTVPFSQSPAISHEPTAEDVLDCLASDASSADQPFEEWCRDYGYEEDSRKAERTYKAVTRQTDKLKRLLGNELETLLEAERL